MKAAVLRGAGHMEIEEVMTPEIKDNEMLIRMLVCGTCLSEYPDWKNGDSVGQILEIGRAHV